MPDPASPNASPAAVVRPPVLDVLIPHYRDVAALELSLGSVAAQSWPGALRVVIVDDGSPPSVLDEVVRLAGAQPFPVTVRSFDQNRGRQFARNALLEEVDAPYVAWLDAGEVWYEDKLRLQFEHLRRLEVDGVDTNRVWVTCHYDWLQDGAQRRVEQRVTADQRADLLIGDSLRAYLWTLLGRTSAFRLAGRFDEALPRLQDLDYFIRFVEAGGRLTVPDVERPLCRYDKSDTGRNHRDIAACSALIMRKHWASYARYGSGFVARAEWKYAKLSARFARSNRDYLWAAKYLLTATVAHPRYAAYRARRSVIGR